MFDMGESKAWLFGLIILLSFIGGVVGYMLVGTTWGIGSGILICAFYAIRVSISELAPIFHSYAFETPAPAAPQAPAPQQVVEKYFVINIDNVSHRLSFFDMSIEQWKELGQLVVRSNYAYNQGHFEKVLGRQEERGRHAYYQVSGALGYDDRFLAVYGNGYKLTPAGEDFFDKVAKGDWRVLNGLEDNTND